MSFDLRLESRQGCYGMEMLRRCVPELGGRIAKEVRATVDRSETGGREGGVRECVK